MLTTLSMRVSHYDGAGAQRLRDDLTHLEEAARSSDATVPWLARSEGDESFRLVTVSLDGRLAGYAAGTLRGDHVELQRLLTVPAAEHAEPGLTQTLVDVIIELFALRHPKVSLACDSRALGHLMHVGWRPVVAENLAEGQVMVEHTGMHRHG
ncbi:hypothetical protein [Arsenicicoccus dermatophilus]|uniref:hypothetical protein n=1 Tax=Arsenicicoccus dermatophilus TaxID=1076331 RepID=UPI00391706B2